MAKKIQTQAVLFLAELDFIEKRSENTLKAYASDLHQSLVFLQEGHFRGPKIDGFSTYSFIPSSESSTSDDESALNEEQLHREISRFLHSISGLESSSRGRKIAALRKFYNFLKREKVVSTIPSILVTPKKAVKLPHFISVDEVLAILSSFKNIPKSLRAEQQSVLFLLLYGAGLRVTEACELKWEHVDIEGRKLRITGKGGKTRVITFPVLLQKPLLQLRGLKKSGSLWGNMALHRRTAYNLIRECGAQASLNKPLNPHALRHSFASHLLSDGADLRIIQELLGHANLSATEKYTHISLDQLAQTMESFHPLAKKA
jgi:integrase/recombinase XerC/integrase/recombinase XerD